MVDFIVVAIVLACLVLIAMYYVKRKKSGKSAGCECSGCDHCYSASSCHTAQTSSKKNE